MNFELKVLPSEQIPALSADALIVLLPETPAKRAASGALGELVKEALQSGQMEAGCAKPLHCFPAPGFKAKRVVLVRCGAKGPVDVRKAVAAAVSLLKGPGVRRLGLVTQCFPLDAAGVAAAVQAVAESTYVYTATKPSAKARSLERCQILVEQDEGLRQGLLLGRARVAGVELAREWANRPANHATPAMLADAARKLGRAKGFRTEILGPEQVQKLGMGAFLAVARGSAQPPRFIVMHYQGAGKGDAPVVLVGKGITFDTGGISIKPAAGMDEMKFDMGGAASVLGTFAALAESRPRLNVVGLIPACENMPDGEAVKPGDVVTSMSGQTIEILNTDAEGRLILCDALTYAARFKPRCVIDIATLTGACVIALGNVRTGLFTADDELAAALQAAGDMALDLCWRMPLDDEYAEGLKSSFADLANVAGREAGAVTAAKFLQKFASDLRWAHLDIAGTAWKSGAAKGATGRPVPLLLEFLIRESESGKAGRVAARTKRS
ncbi:MAG TPA: leucyl aminopeptidase [Paracoccaceae bacterium]|uniref:leucyl aminopeptidase n=1 Tax=Hydrogenophaga sp. TaxID=1904254 RepID=UPI002BB2EB59|nr:leucyl aminopeptidase [Hydrogenophaga sp.]HMO06083.1 leucyl aminopeptidase [Paracoccaceae bacterium]HMP10660.1 leucyl aminopeptidase [Hydrogenophaga sp.]